MIADKLVETARTLMADDKGLLAIDESSATCKAICRIEHRLN